MSGHSLGLSIPILYYDDLCPQARSCCMLIKVLDVDVELKHVNLISGEHLGEAYSKINPSRTVPTLVDGNVTLYDGHTIMIYLCDKYASKYGPPVMPKDYLARLEIFNLLFFEACVLHRCHSHFLTDILLHKYPNFDVDFHKGKIIDCYSALNSFLHDRTFLAGHCVSIGNVVTWRSMIFIPKNWPARQASGATCGIEIPDIRNVIKPPNQGAKHSLVINRKITIADFSAITTLSVLDLLLPISINYWPNLKQWFDRLKILPWYKFNADGIAKQREVLEIVGKFPFPSPLQQSKIFKRKVSFHHNVSYKEIFDDLPEKKTDEQEKIEKHVQFQNCQNAIECSLNQAATDCRNPVGTSVRQRTQQNEVFSWASDMLVSFQSTRRETETVTVTENSNSPFCDHSFARSFVRYTEKQKPLNTGSPGCIKESNTTDTIIIINHKTLKNKKNEIKTFLYIISEKVKLHNGLPVLRVLIGFNVNGAMNQKLCKNLWCSKHTLIETKIRGDPSIVVLLAKINLISRGINTCGEDSYTHWTTENTNYFQHKINAINAVLNTNHKVYNRDLLRHVHKTNNCKHTLRNETTNFMCLYVLGNTP
uniref:GST N-terminal domain-containing protein n=1 Tax=Glossina brevipalpis TaxID=37001 RepID=A0A1A9WI10_9MUSC